MPRTLAPTRLNIAIALLIIYVVWGSTYLAIKFAVVSVPPLMMAGIRFSVAGAILLAIVAPRNTQPLEWRHWLSCMLVGGMLLIGGNGPVCWASQFVPSGISALVVSTAPIWFAVLDWTIFRGPRPGPLTVVGLAAGLGGVYFLIDPHKFDSHDPTAAVPLWPALSLLSACFFWTLGSLLSRRLPLPNSPLLATAMEMFTAGVALIALSFATGEYARVRLDQLDARGLISLAYLIVFGSLIAFSAYVWLIRVCSPAVVSTYAYVNPMVAVALGALFADERITSRLLIGAATIVASVVLITTQAALRKSAATRERASATALASDPPRAVAAGARGVD